MRLILSVAVRMQHQPQSACQRYDHIVRNHQQEFKYRACVSTARVLWRNPAALERSLGVAAYLGTSITSLPAGHWREFSLSFSLCLLPFHFIFSQSNFHCYYNTSHELWAPVAIFVQLSQHLLCNNGFFCNLQIDFCTHSSFPTLGLKKNIFCIPKSMFLTFFRAQLSCAFSCAC